MGKLDIGTANSTRISLSDFRDKVNNGKDAANLGYVRLNSDAKIHKVSKHWYSLPFHNMRSNVSKEYNLAMRRAFVQALEYDTRYMGETEGATFRKLEERIINKMVDGKPVENCDSLSRKEVADILKEFDKGFNTVAGRRQILDNILKHFAGKCAIAKDDFLEKCMGLDRTYFEQALKPEENGAKLRGFDEMAMDEMSFRQFIRDFEEKAMAALERHEAQAGIRNLALAHLANDTDVGFSYNLEHDENIAKLRAGLVRDLGNVIRAFKGQETALRYLDIFLKHVLPAAIRQTTNDIRAMGFTKDGNPEEFETLFNEGCGIKKIAEYARNFLAMAAKGCADPENWRRDLSNSFGDGSKVTRFFKMVLGKGLLNAAKGQVAWGNLPLGEGESYLKELGADYLKALPILEKEVVDDLFVKSFLVQNFGADPSKKVDEKAAVTEKMAELRDNVVLALRVNVGERVAGRDTRSITDYVSKAVAAGVGILKANVEGIDDETINQIFEFTLPNVVNRKISAVHDGASSLLNSEDFAALFSKFTGTARGVVNFKAAADAEFDKATKTFGRFFDAMARKGGWKIDGYRQELMSAFQKDFREMCENTVREFLDGEVFGEEEEDYEAATQSIMAKFAANKSELMGRYAARLKAYAFTRLSGIGEKAALSNGQVEAMAFVNALNERNKQAGKPFFEDSSYLEALASGPLARAWDEAVVANIPKDGKLTEKIVGKIRSAFEKAASGEFKKALDIKTRFEKELGQSVRNYIKECFAEDGLLGEYAALEVADRAKVADWIGKAVMASLAGQSRAIVLGHLRNPSRKVRSDELGNIVDHLLGANGKGNIVATIVRLADGHAKAVADVMTYKMAEEIRESVSFSLAADEAMRKNGSGLGFAECENFVEKVVGNFVETDLKDPLANIRIFDRARKFPLLYPADSAGFANAVREETVAALKARVEQYRVFRDAFIAGAEAGPEADYSSLGEEKLGVARRYFLKNFSKMETPPRPEVAVGMYRDALRRVTNEAIEKTYREFEAYAAAYERAYDIVIPRVKAVFEKESVTARLQAVGAPQAAIDYMLGTVLPRYIDGAAADISRNPENCTEQNGEFAAGFAEDFLKGFIEKVEELRIDNDEGLCRLIAKCGYERQLKDGATREMMLGNLRLWGKDEGVVERHAQMVVAELAEKYAQYRFADEYVRSKNVQADLDKFASDAKGVIGDMFQFALVEKFNVEHVASAKAQIECFIEDGWKITDKAVQDEIREIFYKRIYELTEKARLGQLTDGDVILDFSLGYADNHLGTLDNINEVVNTKGRESFIIKLRAPLAHAKTLERVKAGNPECFNANREGLGPDVFVAISRNANDLMRYVNDVVDKCTSKYLDEHEKFHDAVADIASFDNLVDEEADKGLAALLAVCERRVDCMRQLPEVEKACRADFLAEFGKILSHGSKYQPGMEAGLLDFTLGADGSLSKEQLMTIGTEELRNQTVAFVKYVFDLHARRMAEVAKVVEEENEGADKLRERFAALNATFFDDLMKIACPQAMADVGIVGKSRLILGAINWARAFLDKLAGDHAANIGKAK